MRDGGSDEQSWQPGTNFSDGGQVFQKAPVFTRLEEEIPLRDVPAPMLLIWHAQVYVH
jgi:hypothetical protein